ncbi:MAG: DUF4432 family protein [Chitinivibrionales bacterium]|nr:DUF4432 family protein [Chitinivibrionales bacterium]
MAEPVSHILTDTRNRVWQEHFELGPKALGLSEKPRWSVKKRTLRGGFSDGVDIIEIDNGLLSFSVLPTRGMSIWRGKLGDLPIGWDSPVCGPVHPAFVNERERGGLGWLRGFDEAIVRCGLASNGAPCSDTVTNNMGQNTQVELTLHGKTANTPAWYVAVEVTPGDQPEIAVIGQVYETGLFLPQLSLATRISTTVGSNAFRIEDEITNMKGVPSEMQLLYHCNFGPPFLEEGSRLEVPARMVAPRDARAAEGIDAYDTYLGPTDGYVEQCYWYETLADDDGNTLAMLRTGAGDKAVAIRYNRNELPCFTQWKNTAAEADGYVTGLEPGTNFPNPRPFERAQGRVPAIDGGASYHTALTVEILDGAAMINDARQEIDHLQGKAEKVVHHEPQKGYSDV